MKLIIYSIIGCFTGLYLSSVVLNIGGQAGDFGIALFGLIGFFSPSLYVLDKINKNLINQNRETDK